jgi:vancomycin resistance protein VanJ
VIQRQRLVARIAHFYSLCLLALALLHRLRPARGGLRGLTAVFAPYLFLPLLALALAGRRRAELPYYAALLAGAVAFRAYHVPRPRDIRRAASSGARQFSVMSWNMLYTNPAVDAMLDFLATAPAEVVTLQEVTPEHLERIAGHAGLACRYPHQVLWPYGYGAGIAVLSRYPIVEHGRIERPPTIWARLELGARHQVVLVSTHPTFFPSRMFPEKKPDRRSLGDLLSRLLDPRFIRYDPSHRDAGIAAVRALIAPMLWHGEPLLLAGDCNVTPREPAYRELVSGLRDSHLYAGSGTGLTWRPEWLAALPVALLRIDYLLAGPGVWPVRTWVDRTPRGSDHCPIYGIFGLNSDPAAAATPASAGEAGFSRNDGRSAQSNGRMLTIGATTNTEEVK